MPGRRAAGSYVPVTSSLYFLGTVWRLGVVRLGSGLSTSIAFSSSESSSLDIISARERLGLLVGVLGRAFVFGLLAGVERTETLAPPALPPILRFRAATCSLTALAVGWKSSSAKGSSVTSLIHLERGRTELSRPLLRQLAEVHLDIRDEKQKQVLIPSWGPLLGHAEGRVCD